MTNEEIQKLMEFIITQQAEITAKQAKFETRQDHFETRQAQILDIHFETARRQVEHEKYLAEFEIKFNNKLDALLDWQAKFSLDLEAGREEIQEIKNTLKKTNNTLEETNNILKETNDTLKQVSNLAIETSKRVDKLEDKKEN